MLPSDLRQDMLTLQMIQLMENLWKKEGLDLRYDGKFFFIAPPLIKSSYLTQHFDIPDAQDDPVWLFIHREQDGTYRGGQELGHHRKHPAKQQQQCRHCCLQQGRSAQLAQIQESRVSVGILVELLREDGGAVRFAKRQASNCKTF